MKGEPWLRLYTSIYESDDKTQRLSDKLFRQWVLILCAYKRNGETMPELADLAWGLRISLTEAKGVINNLKKARLVDVTSDGLRPHDWDGRQFGSDVSTGRVQALRKRRMEPSRNGGETADGTPAKRSRNVSRNADETPPETAEDRSRNVSETADDCSRNVSETVPDYRLQNSSLKLAAESDPFGGARESSQPAKKTPGIEPGKLNAARALLVQYPLAFEKHWDAPDDVTVERILEPFDGDTDALDQWLARVVRKKRRIGPGQGWGLLVTMARHLAATRKAAR